MGLDKAQKYLTQRQINTINDWGATELDTEGLALQAELEQRQTVRRELILIPMHRCLLTYITALASSAHQVLLDLLSRETRKGLVPVFGILHPLAGWISAHPPRAAQIFEVGLSILQQD